MKRIFLTFAAVAAIVSCKKAEDQIQPQAPEVTITAEHLKTVIDNDGAVKWDGDEKISVIFTHSETNGSYVAEFENGNEAGATARFVGTMDPDVNTAAGWSGVAYCVCPSSSVDAQTGEVMHSLPAEQYAHSSGSGSFETGLNLSYAPLSLAELEAESQGKAMFENALSVLRLVPGSDDITSITINASASLVGDAPMVFEDGKLVIDQDGDWGENSNSVILRPSEGNECFTEGVTYNILVYPGAHTSFSVTLNYKEYGDYTKTLKSAPTFKPAKYYTIGFTSNSEAIITELANDVTGLENRLPSLDELEELEENVKGLVNQIQSISLMTEYLDNAVYARYAQMTYSKQKMDLSLDYIIRPEAAAEALVEAFNQNSEVVSALLGYGKGAGLEIQATPLAVKNLLIKNVTGVGKVVTATVDASSIDNKFYEGSWDASVALQISSGKTDIISDFANLVPKTGNAILGSNRIAAVPGARVVIPFNYSISGEVTPVLEVSDSQGVNDTRLQYGNNSGHLTVYFEDGEVGTPSVTLTLTVGEGESREVISHTFTFFDDGLRINVEDPGEVDYIGGDVIVNVTTQNIMSGGIMTLISGECEHSGNIFSFSQNDTYAERTASVEYSVPVGENTVIKDITLTQKAKGTELSRTYYTNGQKVVLNQANASGCSNYFNIVILGDGYQKKDLVAGGKFERSARSTMDSFFAIEPYKTFKDRFNVYMVAYESVDEGTDIKSSSIDKNTYFGSYCQGGGNTAAYVADTAPVINAVKSAVGSGDATYYRSIAILLLNTDEQAGSTGYPFRDYKDGWPNGYASFAIAALAANSTGTNGLIKHEAGGHAFGRLADEYYTNGTTASSANKSDLSNWHAKGWYWNVNPSNSGNYYQFTNSDYSSEISFIEGAWGYQYGIYRPTQGGMMQGSTGVFNAPSRHAIYHRIITESQGASAYSWSNFKDYDQKNR